MIDKAPVTQVTVDIGNPGSLINRVCDRAQVQQLLVRYRENVKGLKGQEKQNVEVIIGRLEAALKLFD